LRELQRTNDQHLAEHGGPLENLLDPITDAYKGKRE